MLRDRGIKLLLEITIGRNVIRFCLVAFLFCFSLSAQNVLAVRGDSSLDKDTISVNVSTVDYDNWFDDRCTNGLDDDHDGYVDSKDNNCDGGMKGLSPVLICDENGSASSYYDTPFPVDLTHKPCDKDGVHDDYYSTNASNETYIQPTDKNFTIRVSASDFSGIDSIRIEWISGVSRNRDAGQYWNDAKLANFAKSDTNLNPHKASFTCKNATSCEICVVGGTCAYPVIPKEDLGIVGLQQIILFRAVITDGAMNSVVTGFDESDTSPKLDKFYRFVVCSSTCNTTPSECSNIDPTVEVSGTSEDFACFESIPLYTLKWKFIDDDSKDRPGSYILEVRDRSKNNAIYTAARTAPGGLVCNKKRNKIECDMSATLFQGFLSKSDGSPASIEWGNKTYDWRVKVYDDSDELHCLGVSAWSSEWGSDSMASFTTPYALPTPSFTVENSAAMPLNCFSGGCEFAEEIVFKSTSSIDINTGTPSYKWYIDGSTVYGTENIATKIFMVSAEKKSAKLVVTDGFGRSCAIEKSFSLSVASNSADGAIPKDNTEEKDTSWSETVK
ncbi:MAG: hypothetical protein WC180_02115 [Candidatus Paceibacterota bacterium]